MIELLPQKGSNAERSKHRNRQAILAQVRAAGAVGRAEIARALSLTTQTVSNIIAELSQDGFLLEKGRLSAGRGLPAIQYALNPEGGYALGIEVRPDAIFAALLDMQGTAVATDRVTINQSDPAMVTMHVKALLAQALDKVPNAKGRTFGAGIVMPGPFGVTGINEMGSELHGWQQIDAASQFAEAIGLPVVLSNDANAAAMAERINGVAREITSYAYLYFGAGLGLGLVYGGQLIRGAYENAGEIGHIPIPDSGDKLEDVVSRLSVRRYLETAGKSVRDIEALDMLFQQDDPDLIAWLKTASDALSRAIAIVENLFDPQTIILGGAMPETLLDYLVKETPLPEVSVSNRPDKAYPRLMRGTSGRMTATLGAAALILNKALSPPVSHTY